MTSLLWRAAPRTRMGRRLRVVLVAPVLTLALSPVSPARALPAPTEPREPTKLQEIESLIEIGRHDQALRRLEDYLEENPSDVQALFMKGLGLAETGRFDEAIAILSKLTAEHPELPQPFNNLAVLHAMRGDLEKAREVLLAAIEAQPDNPRYHENLADVYVELAARSYERSIELAPPGGAAASKLGLLDKVLPAPPSGTDAPGPEPPPPAAPRSEGSPGERCAGAVTAVHAWAEAWSSQDVAGYVRSYAADYAPASGLSRDQWVAQRRRRLERPRFIEVSLRELAVELCGERRALLSFVQNYRSNTYQDRVRKALWLSRPAEAWVITSEQTRN